MFGITIQVQWPVSSHLRRNGQFINQLINANQVGSSLKISQAIYLFQALKLLLCIVSILRNFFSEMTLIKTESLAFERFLLSLHPFLSLRWKLMSSSSQPCEMEIRNSLTPTAYHKWQLKGIVIRGGYQPADFVFIVVTIIRKPQ